jgi:hypothetical protein
MNCQKAFYVGVVVGLAFSIVLMIIATGEYSRFQSGFAIFASLFVIAIIGWDIKMESEKE